MQMALKCADLGHLAAPWPVHQKWVAGLEEELFRQGDNEKQLLMPVSPLMDRSKGGITKSQVTLLHLPYPFALIMIQRHEASVKIFRYIYIAGAFAVLTTTPALSKHNQKYNRRSLYVCIYTHIHIHICI